MAGKSSGSSSATRSKTPRLGRGLSSLMGTAVPVTPPPPPSPPASSAPSESTATAPPTAPQVSETQDGATAAKNTTAAPPAPAPTPSAPAAPVVDGLIMVVPADVVPNPFQPRQVFHDAALAELAESIKQSGLMQPPIVRRVAGESTQYQLVAGERRWRAAQLAGLEMMPVILRELDDRQVNEWALVENLQREDLDPIEKAEAFHNLADRFSLSHDEIAQKVGVNRSTITNSLRLLNLHPDVQALVRQGSSSQSSQADGGKAKAGLSAGHAKALAGLSDQAAQLQLARLAANAGWSVRQLEEAVRRRAEGTGEDGKAKDEHASKSGKSGKPAHLADLEARLAEELQTKVRVRAARKKGAGTLEIDFYDLDQFDALMQRLDITID